MAIPNKVLSNIPVVAAGDPAHATPAAVSPAVDGAGNAAQLLTDASGFLKVNVAAGGAGGGAVTVADGADVTQGAVVDAAVSTDASGTVNAHIRGLVKLLASCISIGSGWLQVSIQNATLAVVQAGNAASLSGQVAVTASAVALAANACKSVTVKALVGNTANVYAGPAGITIATGYELAPGDSITMALANTSALYLIAAAGGSSISWIAAN
jgi:hypothetical protein